MLKRQGPSVEIPFRPGMFPSHWEIEDWCVSRRSTRNKPPSPYGMTSHLLVSDWCNSNGTQVTSLHEYTAIRLRNWRHEWLILGVCPRQLSVCFGKQTKLFTWRRRAPWIKQRSFPFLAPHILLPSLASLGLHLWSLAPHFPRLINLL